MVIERLGESANRDILYQGVLCCKCHELLVVPDGSEMPEPYTDDCKRRWEDYHRKIDEYIKIHGPLGA